MNADDVSFLQVSINNDVYYDVLENKPTDADSLDCVFIPHRALTPHCKGLCLFSTVLISDQQRLRLLKVSFFQSSV